MDADDIASYIQQNMSSTEAKLDLFWEGCWNKGLTYTCTVEPSEPLEPTERFEAGEISDRLLKNWNQEHKIIKYMMQDFLGINPRFHSSENR